MKTSLYDPNTLKCELSNVKCGECPKEDDCEIHMAYCEAYDTLYSIYSEP